MAEVHGRLDSHTATHSTLKADSADLQESTARDLAELRDSWNLRSSNLRIRSIETATAATVDSAAVEVVAAVGQAGWRGKPSGQAGVARAMFERYDRDHDGWMQVAAHGWPPPRSPMVIPTCSADLADCCGCCFSWPT